MRQVIIVIVGLSLGFCLSYFTLPRNSEVVYNCDMAEFHPDYPPKVKQKCREIRNENSTSK